MTIQVEMYTKGNTLMFRNEFLEYIKLAENAPLLKEGKDAVHRSPEGGNDTVGFGHKLTDAEKKAGKVYGIALKDINAQNAEKILMMDLMKRDKALSTRLGKKYDSLDQKRKEMLLDMEFNVGTVEKEFPEFTKAIFKNDMPSALKESKRFYKEENSDKPVELTRRNKLFEQTFFSSSEPTQAEENIQPAIDAMKAPPARQYAIQQGDTFYSMAQQLGIPVQQLMTLNPGTMPSTLRIGQIVNVPNISGD
jgi:GH24 family phage-related lysozyme (muramidase)